MLRMCMCFYVCAFMHVHVYVHVHVCMHMYVNVCVCMRSVVRWQLPGFDPVKPRVTLAGVRPNRDI